MTTRRPLVVISGAVQELPAGDALPADATGGASSILTTQTFSAAAGQLSFTIAGGYTVGQIAVFQNGAKLAPADYAASSGTTIVLSTAAVQFDVVEVVKWSSLTIANAVAKAGDTMTGKLTITGVWANGFEIQTSATDQNSGPGVALTAMGASAQYAQTWMQHILLTGATDLTDTALAIQQRDSSGAFVNNVYQFSYKNQAHALYTGNAVLAYLDPYGGAINGSLAIGLGGTTNGGNWRVFVRGKGSTSVTYALTLQNASSANLFLARDDGALNLGAAPASPQNQTNAAAPNLYMDANGWLYKSTYSQATRTLIGTLATSVGAASATITGLPTGYDTWQFELDGVTPNASASILNMAVSADGATFETQTLASGSFDAASNASGVFTLTQVSAAGVNKLAGGGVTGGGGTVASVGARFVSQTGALTAARFAWNNAATFGAAGTIRIYGVK